jgi:hypothetical protein
MCCGFLSRVPCALGPRRRNRGRNSHVTVTGSTLQTASFPVQGYRWSPAPRCTGDCDESRTSVLRRRVRGLREHLRPAGPRVRSSFRPGREPAPGISAAGPVLAAAGRAKGGPHLSETSLTFTAYAVSCQDVSPNRVSLDRVKITKCHNVPGSGWPVEVDVANLGKRGLAPAPAIGCRPGARWWTVPPPGRRRRASW